jgi:hypothetical protein
MAATDAIETSFIGGQYRKPEQVYGAAFELKVTFVQEVKVAKPASTT